MAKPKGIILIRVNTRILPEQHKFIKEVAKEMGITEGELTRSMLDSYIKSYNRKQKNAKNNKENDDTDF